MLVVTGKDLIAWGYKPGSWFRSAIEAANNAIAMGGFDEDEIKAIVKSFVPAPSLTLRNDSNRFFHMNLYAESQDEHLNVEGVRATMRELMRLPTVVAAAVMPDACPSGSVLGTIPVGGVVATKDAIHPGMHSADICCSMAVSIFDTEDPRGILDIAMKVTHFGPRGREGGQQKKPPSWVMKGFEENMFLRKPEIISAAQDQFMTQGDGNHFLFLGRLASTGQIAIVTHHGSRKPGALLYKAGMAVAEKTRKELAPEIPSFNAWIDANTREGEAYWDALQIVRLWTRSNHYAIHHAIAQEMGLFLVDRYWNEHNFVFRRSDGLYYHAKGATPSFAGFSEDTIGLTLIPLNMAAPILITRGTNSINGLGFAPHGAGRNFSRGEYRRRACGEETLDDLLKEQTNGLDIRFFCGVPDVSELPFAYKNAESVRRQITEFGLVEVVDTIEPIGCITAGDWEVNVPWKKRGK